MSHGRNNSLFIGGFLLNLVAESPKGREVPQGEAFELGRSVKKNLLVSLRRWSFYLVPSLLGLWLAPGKLLYYILKKSLIHASTFCLET